MFVDGPRSVRYNQGMKKIDEIVGANIKRLRQARKLSQQALASMTGLTDVTIGRTEKGKHHAQEISLQAIAKALECSVSDFYADMNLDMPISESVKDLARAAHVANAFTEAANHLNACANASVEQRRMALQLLQLDPTIADDLNLEIMAGLPTVPTFRKFAGMYLMTSDKKWLERLRTFAAAHAEDKEIQKDFLRFAKMFAAKV